YPFRFDSIAQIRGRVAQLPAANLFVFEPDYQQPYTMQGNFGVEYGLTNDLSVGISYLSVQGRHLQRTRDINLAPLVATPINCNNCPGAIVPTFLRHPGATSPTRPISGAGDGDRFGRISQFESNANSGYNALILQVNKRFAQHYQFLFSY